MYDLVLMDNMMPHLTGVEACQAMRAMGFTGVIIGLTGNVFEKDIADYIANGANAVLHKPLVLADLFETLRKIDADSKV
jgi:CheY-like chemotaxis protein